MSTTIFVFARQSQVPSFTRSLSKVVAMPRSMNSRCHPGVTRERISGLGGKYYGEILETFLR
jgi:hypothetical protein